ADNNNDVIAINTTGVVDYRDAGAVTISAVNASGLFNALAAGVSSGNNNINLNVGGNLLLNDAVNGRASIDAGSTGDVRIVTAGTVDQVNAGDNIVADELGIAAGGAVTLTTGNNDVNTLAILTPGLVEFRDTDDLRIGSVAAGGGVGFAS